MQHESYGKMVIISKEAAEKFKDATDAQIDACAYILKDNINESIAKIIRERDE